MLLDSSGVVCRAVSAPLFSRTEQNGLDPLSCPVLSCPVMALALASIYLRHSRSRILRILPHILNSLDVSDACQLQSTGHYARMPNANANVSAGVALGSEEC
jgi:hypothetical protein